MPLLSEMTGALFLDLGDADHVLFTDAALTRCLQRAIAPCSKDTGRLLSFDVYGDLQAAYLGNVVDPNDPDFGLLVEAVSLMAQIYACEQQRAFRANLARSSKSGDESIDRGDQAVNWQHIQAEVQGRYDRIINQLNPAQSSRFLAAPNFPAFSYRAGGCGHGRHGD